jgi:ubiquinone/menaquinone biosynthesis C-methylase UbiE
MGSRLAGCERSIGMIRVARSQVPAGRFVAADAVTLPFRDASFDAVTASFVLSDHFLADRELSSAGRFARHALGADAWSRWLARAREVLGRRFGSAFECTRGVLIGLGARAA